MTILQITYFIMGAVSLAYTNELLRRKRAKVPGEIYLLVAKQRVEPARV